MEDKKLLNNEELDKVAGGFNAPYYELKFQCKKCGAVYYTQCFSDAVTGIDEFNNSPCKECDGKYEYVDMTYVPGSSQPTPIYL